MALFGHIAFCTTEVKGDILTNFGDNLAAQITRIGLQKCVRKFINLCLVLSSFLGFTVAVLISFPFMVTPCRTCIYSVMFSRVSKPVFPHIVHLCNWPCPLYHRVLRVTPTLFPSPSSLPLPPALCVSHGLLPWQHPMVGALAITSQRSQVLFSLHFAVEIVLSLTGSVCGSIVCFIFPALAYMTLPARSTTQFEWKPKVRWLCLFP